MVKRPGWKIAVPDLDEIWDDVPDTPLRPLDAAIAFLEKLEHGIGAGGGDDLLNVAVQARELVWELEALCDRLDPTRAATEKRIRELKDGTA